MSFREEILESMSEVREMVESQKEYSAAEIIGKYSSILNDILMEFFESGKKDHALLKEFLTELVDFVNDMETLKDQE